MSTGYPHKLTATGSLSPVCVIVTKTRKGRLPGYRNNKVIKVRSIKFFFLCLSFIFFLSSTAHYNNNNITLFLSIPPFPLFLHLHNQPSHLSPSLHSHCLFLSSHFPLHLIPVPPCNTHTHTHCPFQSPSSSCSPSPSLTGRYYIFQSVLCMIWGVDEAISRSSPWSLPPSRFSPCCLMFQFGGSKHSIRQINCLMHVISQTVYKRGTLCLSPHPNAHTHTHIHPNTRRLDSPFSVMLFFSLVFFYINLNLYMQE